ncbi:MAG TPA: PAS domain S-box protein, partial [Thermoanaerobaculia bacterium]|nr:PAS domain S-box protein [Thermoanaerobaculia bacterium]
TFLREDEWGRTTRQLALIALTVPALFGALCLFETKAAVFDLPFAVALITTATSFTLIATIARYTTHLRVEDERRRAAEEASRAADALYRTIVETSQEGICVVDAERRFTFVNQRLATMLGYDAAELIGEHSDKIVHPDDRAGVAERAEVRRSHVKTRTELRLLRRDGSILYAISAATLVPATPNAPEFVLATLSDISERVAAEAALRASEARFRSLYEANLIGVAFLKIDVAAADDGGTVNEANDAFREMFEISPDDLPGFAWSTRNTGDGAATDQAALWHLRESGRCAPFEKEFLRRDGSRFAAIIALATIDQETTVAFVIDVSERVAARRTLERAHEILSSRLAALEGGDGSLDVRELETLAARLADANQELETFSYSVSHDLRAPLRAIDGFSRELQTSHAASLDAQGQKYLGRIRAATQRMAQLIDDLLSLSRLARKPMNRVPVDVSAMAGDVANEVRERSGRDVTFAIEPGLATTADPHLLRVVLENLIGNAVKFSSKRDDARVEIFGADGDGTIVVRDNGAGFDSRYADKIFAPFQRLHTSEFEGTGIGLALVQRIVRRHGGTIRAESQPGDGAAFFFTLSSPAEVTA